MKILIERTALIDADFIAYEAAAYAHTAQLDKLEMVEKIQGTIREWQTKAFATSSIICFSCPREENFRRQAYPPYKTHRTADAPAMLETAKEEMSGFGRVVRIPTLEADDVMGILATNGKVKNPVIVSVDKDMRQIPGWHLNPKKEDFPVFVSEEQGEMTLHRQWITGDSSDGYPGIKGMGPAKADKILLPPLGLGETLTDRVLAAYDAAGKTEAEAYAQLVCSRILRAKFWNADERKPILPFLDAKSG